MKVDPSSPGDGYERVDNPESVDASYLPFCNLCGKPLGFVPLQPKQARQVESDHLLAYHLQEIEN